MNSSNEVKKIIHKYFSKEFDDSKRKLRKLLYLEEVEDHEIASILKEINQIAKDDQSGEGYNSLCANSHDETNSFFELGEQISHNAITEYLNNISKDLQHFQHSENEKDRFVNIVFLSLLKKKLFPDERQFYNNELLYFAGERDFAEKEKFCKSLRGIKSIQESSCECIFFDEAETMPKETSIIDDERNNIDQFNRVKEIAKTIHKKINEGNNIKITVIGHTDAIKLSQENPSFKSNYELCKTRMEIVQSLIRQHLFYLHTDEKMIEWELIPRIAEEGEMVNSITTDSFEEKRVVIRITIIPNGCNVHDSQPERNISLLEYIYFTIYTATTTGYGDIFPISAFAKFLACLANILEIYLLVIFFNVYIATSLDRSQGNGKRKSVTDGDDEA